MEKYIVILAPRSWLGAIVRWLLLMVGLAVYDLVSFVIIWPSETFRLRFELEQVVVIGGPFIAISLYMFRVQMTMREQMAHLAATDMLTGLRNRRAFREDVAQLRKTRPGGLIFVLDADHFKQVNDTYGHDTGDLCLKAIAQKVAETVRHDDIIGRLGGEEFAIYMPDADLDEAKSIGNRLSKGITLEHEDGQLTLTMSIGMSRLAPDHDLDPAITIADKALYKAKHTGRARMIMAPNVEYAA